MAQSELRVEEEVFSRKSNNGGDGSQASERMEKTNSDAIDVGLTKEVIYPTNDVGTRVVDDNEGLNYLMGETNNHDNEIININGLNVVIRPKGAGSNGYSK